MNLLDGVVILILVMGLLLGASQRLVRLLMSTLIVCFTLIYTPAVYKTVGNFFASLLMAPSDKGDAVGFLLVALLSIIVLELVMRRAFAETFLPSIGVLDQISGALVGVVWAALAASALLIPLTYTGAMSGPSQLIPVVQAIFRPFALTVLRLLYPPGFAPILDSFIR